MNFYKSLCISSVFIIFCAVFNDLYSIDKENAVVKYIQEKSDLVQSDVDRWKLFWLKSAGEKLAIGLSFYGVYRSGKLGYSIPTAYEQQIVNAFKSLNIPALFANKFENLMKSKFLWAAIGAYGASTILGQFVLERLPSYSFQKIESFLAFCKTLPFTYEKYNSIDGFVRSIPGKIWCKSGAVALQRGFDNLVEQANVAYHLLEQLKSSKLKSDEEVSLLRERVVMIKNNIVHNRIFVTEESIELCKQKKSGFESALELLFLPWYLILKRVSDY